MERVVLWCYNCVVMFPLMTSLRCASGDSEHGKLCATVWDHRSYFANISPSHNEHVWPLRLQGECCKSLEAATECVMKVLPPSWNMFAGFQIIEQVFMLLKMSFVIKDVCVCGSCSKLYIKSLSIYSPRIWKRVISRWKSYRIAPPSLENP